jgi:type II secretory pathway component PulJ
MGEKTVIISPQTTKINKIKGSSGFSIIEACLSMGILSIVTLGVASIFTDATTKITSHRNEATIENKAVNIMEMMRSDTRSALGVEVSNQTLTLAAGTPNQLTGANSDRTNAATGNCLKLYYFKNANGGLDTSRYVIYGFDPSGQRLTRISNIDSNTRMPNPLNNTVERRVSLVDPDRPETSGLSTQCMNNNNQPVPCFMFIRQNNFNNQTQNLNNGLLNGQQVSCFNLSVRMNGLRIQENAAQGQSQYDVFGRNPGFPLDQYTYNLGGGKTFR